MKVCYWAEVNHGSRTFSAHFTNFPDCCVIANGNPLTFRENCAMILQRHVNAIIDNGKLIPEPTGIELPLCHSPLLIGFLPVVVDIPDTFVKEWSANHE